jgi:hypothetical protein
MSQLFQTKSIADLQKEATDSEHGLKRALTATNLVTLGIGATSARVSSC